MKASRDHRPRRLLRHLAEHGRPVEQLRRHRDHPIGASGAELRRDQHHDPGLAQRLAPRRRDDHLDRDHRDDGRHPGAQLRDQPAALRARRLHRLDRRLQRHPPGPERPHDLGSAARPHGHVRSARRRADHGGGTGHDHRHELLGATAVNFGTTPAHVYTVNSSTRSPRPPRPASAGTVDVTVTTPGARAPRARPTSSPTTLARRRADGDLAEPDLRTDHRRHGGHDHRHRTSLARPPSTSAPTGRDLHRQRLDPDHRHRAGRLGGSRRRDRHDARRHERDERRRPVHLCDPRADGLGVEPDLGSSAGGTTVTITGTNFTGATAVKFGHHRRDLQPSTTRRPSPPPPRPARSEAPSTSPSRRPEARAPRTPATSTPTPPLRRRCRP